LAAFQAAEAAAREFSPAEVRTRELSRSMRGVGFVMIELGKLDEAERKFREALQLDPADAGAARELQYIEKLRAEAASAAGRDETAVVFRPGEDFPFQYAAALAKLVAADTGLRVRAMLPLGARDWKANAGGQQYDPAALRDLAGPVIEQLKKSYGGK